MNANQVAILSMTGELIRAFNRALDIYNQEEPTHKEQQHEEEKYNDGPGNSGGGDPA